uniref:SJCHGC02252 protein n=1 Tax=Schistosoma japonicum TaxID=6182 RepID=Q5D9R7_SCHJA|nr:SJCHGC02252 protein [Schistosoma japonicum]
MPPDSSRGDNSKNKGGQKSSKENINLYAILEVDRNATAEEIRKSYRRLALKYHPDKNVKDPGASEKFKEINRAHSILANEQKRKLYDRYGSLGIYVAEHIDEEDWKPYLALRNPCVQCLACTCFLLTCCCCCLCCCYCCGTLYPRNHPVPDEMNEAFEEPHFEMPMNMSNAETFVTKQPNPAPAVNLYAMPTTSSSEFPTDNKQ